MIVASRVFQFEEKGVAFRPRVNRLGQIADPIKSAQQFHDGAYVVGVDLPLDSESVPHRRVIEVFLRHLDARARWSPSGILRFTAGFATFSFFVIP